jgi:predicted nucleotidyltransferase
MMAMKRKNEDLIKKVRTALRSVELTWEELSKRTHEIILFGSTAANCDTKHSDVDLLCVGSGARYDTDKLHLLWVAQEQLHDPAWLATELGGHIAEYGVWLKGEKSVQLRVPASKRTIEKKRTRIRDRCTTLLQRWDSLSRFFKQTQLRNLRLDLQRFSLLMGGAAVPPSPLLDKAWESQDLMSLIDRCSEEDTDLAQLVRRTVEIATSDGAFSLK